MPHIPCIPDVWILCVSNKTYALTLLKKIIFSPPTTWFLCKHFFFSKLFLEFGEGSTVVKAEKFMGPNVIADHRGRHLLCEFSVFSGFEF